MMIRIAKAILSNLKVKRYKLTTRLRHYRDQIIPTMLSVVKVKD